MSMNRKPSSTPPPAPPLNSSNSANYFVDQKKGEVLELKQLLKNLNVEKDINKKRDVIKKVIAYMTLGIDVSRLFSDMIMAIETKDIVIKKMVYLYLCNYAHKQPDMAIMCVNTLRRDCDNEDPMIRGLALRSLCSLRLESILEYLEGPIRKSLSDISPYVRKTGVMGILKLKYLNANLIAAGNYIELLEQKLQDIDPSVISNVLLVLDELLHHQGGFRLSQTLLMYLLSRIGEFSEWGLNHLLELITRYRPASEDEVFSIMNLLDPALRTSNCGSILAVIKCFLHLTNAIKLVDLHRQVFMRVKPPLLTMITGGTPEIQHILLKHLEIILEHPMSKGVFDDEFRQFYVRYNESSHVKYIKVIILSKLTNTQNAFDIFTELNEYVTDVDHELSQLAMRSLTNIALTIPEMTLTVLLKFIELMEVEMETIQSQVVNNISIVLKKNPAHRHLVIPHLPSYLRLLDELDAKSAVIWMIGEYGSDVADAPYILEPIIDSYTENLSNSIKLNLLTATMKLFFKRSPEVSAMLGRLMSKMLNDSSNQDVHDRTLLYYRLLRFNIQLAEKVCLREVDCDSGAQLGSVSASDVSASVDKMILQFNSLAAIYGRGASEFIAKDFQLQDSKTEAFSRRSDRDSRKAATNEGSLVSEERPNRLTSSLLSSGTSSTSTSTSNLLDLSVHTTPTAATHAPQQAYTNGSSPIPKGRAGIINEAELNSFATFRLLPEEFQQLWSGGNINHSTGQLGPLVDLYDGFLCGLANFPVPPSTLEEAFNNIHITTMASGPLPAPIQGLKMFLYAKRSKADGAPSELLLSPTSLLKSVHVVYLVQLALEKNSNKVLVSSSRADDDISVRVVIKGTSNISESDLMKFTTQVTSALEIFGII